jgi:glutathione synthase/RimK-type ligase-like ATP-grasp enzyme
MNEALAILDYSMHDNTIDVESDRLLAVAAAAAGFDTVVQPIAPEKDVRPDAKRVWLRYDLRSRRELSWIVSVAHDLHGKGHWVFPSAISILLAEDKWEAYHALRDADIPTPRTFLALALPGRGLPAILKPRCGWGGQGNRIVRNGTDQDSLARLVAEDYIGQPFIEHCRTWIVPVAHGHELLAIEARRESDRDGDFRVLPLPDGGAGLSAAAVAAVSLPAGTADLIEGPEGPMILEVNSAPCISYPDLPEVDLATPMVRAVLDWMETCRCES